MQAGKIFYQKVPDALEMMAVGYAGVLFLIYSSLCGQFWCISSLVEPLQVPGERGGVVMSGAWLVDKLPYVACAHLSIKLSYPQEMKQFVLLYKSSPITKA